MGTKYHVAIKKINKIDKWHSGRCATWDVTVVDTLGNAYIQQSAISGARDCEIFFVGKFTSVRPSCFGNFGPNVQHRIEVQD